VWDHTTQPHWWPGHFGRLPYLTRLWLSDELPPNSESRVIGMVLRSLRSTPRSGSCSHMPTLRRVTWASYTRAATALRWPFRADPALRPGRRPPPPLPELRPCVWQSFRAALCQSWRECEAGPAAAQVPLCLLCRPVVAAQAAVPVLPYPRKGSKTMETIEIRLEKLREAVWNLIAWTMPSWRD